MQLHRDQGKILSKLVACGDEVGGLLDNCFTSCLVCFGDDDRKVFRAQEWSFFHLALQSTGYPRTMTSISNTIEAIAINKVFNIFYHPENPNNDTPI